MDNHSLRYYRLLKILSWLPFFRVTDDENFGTLRPNSEQLRLSLLSINLGPLIFFLFTYGFRLSSTSEEDNRFPKEFRLIYCLPLSLVDQKLDEGKLRSLREQHKMKLSTMEPEERSVMKETLLFKYDQLKERQTRTFNKFLAYLAVIAFIIPIFIPAILKLSVIFDNPGWVVAVYCILGYYLISSFWNVTAFLYYFIRVGYYTRFKYILVKESDLPDIAFLDGLYSDRYKLDVETIKEVTIIRNIEKYMAGIVIMSILFLSFYLLVPVFSAKAASQLEHTSQYQVNYIDLSQSPQSVMTEWRKYSQLLETGLLSDQIRQIILLRSGEEDKGNYLRILQVINSYNVHQISISEISDKPSSILPKNTLQIIIERK